MTNEATTLPILNSLGVATLVLVTMGIILLLISWLRIRLVALFARRRQDVALSELSQLIAARLETPALLTATSVKGLAVSIEQKYNCPMITDKLIAEAIRSAAITLEYAVKGEELERRLRLLNNLLLSIDQSASPLASIAVVDRLGAYIQSQPILVGVLLLVLIVQVARPIFIIDEWSWTIFTVVAVVTVAAFLLCVSTERAIRFWRQQEETKQDLEGTVPGFNRPRILTDFFLTASTSRARWTGIFWNQVWGPFWENVMFLWRSERQVAAMHEFRFDFAQDLWRELKAADIKLEQSQNTDPITRVVLQQRFLDLVRKLWIVTGDPQFREIEIRGSILREDRESGIVGLL